MVSLEMLQKMALSLGGVTEQPHFEKTSFRVKNKIFATYDDKLKIACVKLSESDQDIFSLTDSLSIYPVKNKWGKQGWTLIEMNKIKKRLFADLLKAAYDETF